MTYFLLNLVLCLMLSACLFILLVYRLRINREQKNRHPAGYVLPVLIAAVFVIITLQLTVPRVLDSFSILTKRYNVEETTLMSQQIGKNTVEFDGNVYFFSRLQFDPRPDIYYMISSTIRSKYIISISQVVEGDAEVVSGNQ